MALGLRARLLNEHYLLVVIDRAMRRIHMEITNGKIDKMAVKLLQN